MNSATFIGRIGRDAELKYTPSGTPVCTISLAIDQGKDKEGQKKSAVWIDATLWEKRAEALAQYLTKGKMVAVVGPVSARAWIGKDNGDAQCKLIVTVRELEFCGGPKSENDGEQHRPAQAPPPVASAADSGTITDEDIPF